MKAEALVGLCVLMVCLALGCVGACAFNGCYAGYSSGERTGVVTKISKKGFLFKSWEGQMALGGMVNGGGAFGETWNFSTLDDSLAERLRAASERGDRITLIYHEWLSSPVRIDTDHEIERIKQ